MSIRDVLAENFESLRNAGKRLYSLPDITKAGGGSNGTLGRILKKDSGATIDTVEQLARTYRLETWQLLVPGLDPKAPPVIQGKAGEWPFVHFNQAMAAASINALRDVTLMIVACIARQPNIDAHRFKKDLESMVEAQYPQGDLVPPHATDLIAAVHQVLGALRRGRQWHPVRHGVPRPVVVNPSTFAFIGIPAALHDQR